MPEGGQIKAVIYFCFCNPFCSALVLMFVGAVGVLGCMLWAEQEVGLGVLARCAVPGVETQPCCGGHRG